ncbi:VPS4-associated protein 1 [Boeremia exigua]|uniref:VPS4-associated protein 1 n=1 Tax=Boeremia exigua TaxID=749465 RepID=UPI001E8DE596|nr:VPS4-associated protein 1 [Boeremia exigua]KAH6639412.1 VPS4-associated protein 1 [Boeremia exigua]
MSKAPFENTWYHRKVAENATKPCNICYKPTSSVLITPSNKDFFYVCIGHLSDRGFCQPDADEAAELAERKKKEEMDREVEKVKKEYEEKQKLKKEKRKAKDKEKDKETKATEEEEDKKDEKAKDDKIKELSKSGEASSSEATARIYHLNKSFYQMRLDKLRNAEIAKRNRERLQNPANFPSVPKNLP